MARKKARRPGSSSGKGSSSGARKPKSTASISRRDPWGKPVGSETRRRVLAAAALVRRGEATLSEALGQEHTTLTSFLKFPGLYRRRLDGTIQVAKGDTYKRDVKIYVPLRYRDGDVRSVTVHSYKEAAFASRYDQTVNKVLRGKLPPSALKEFEGVAFGKEKQPVLTDWQRIKRLAEAGIRIDEFYVEPGGTS
jgi:hypothetical protein